MTDDQRFTELPDEPAVPPQQGPNSRSRRSSVAQKTTVARNEVDRNQDGSEPDSGSEPETWWTPSELRVSPGACPSHGSFVRWTAAPPAGPARWEVCVGVARLSDR